jgi:clusterin-associated protein 1
MGNFQTPNFELVADMLYWMAKRYYYDQGSMMHITSIPMSVATQQQRVEFIVGLCKEIFKLSSSTINMDPYRVYSADGHAVKELLKLALVLFKAHQIALESDDEGDNNGVKLERFKGGSIDININEATALATEIIDLGTQVQELLLFELENHPRRTDALKFLDAMTSSLDLCTEEHNHVETRILRAIQTTREELGELTHKNSDLVAEEHRLQLAIKKRERDIERNQQRLDSLKTMRPSFLDEYEELEKEYQKQYDIFVERYRNVDYLEHEAADVCDKAEKNSAMHQTLLRLQKQNEDDELRLTRTQEDPQFQKDGRKVLSESTVW